MPPDVVRGGVGQPGSTRGPIKRRRSVKDVEAKIDDDCRYVQAGIEEKLDSR